MLGIESDPLVKEPGTLYFWGLLPDFLARESASPEEKAPSADTLTLAGLGKVGLGGIEAGPADAAEAALDPLAQERILAGIANLAIAHHELGDQTQLALGA
jgi:hypothetical protein